MPDNDVKTYYHVMPDLIGYRVQKHSESARDTPKNEGIASTFPIKMHLVIFEEQTFVITA